MNRIYDTDLLSSPICQICRYWFNPLPKNVHSHTIPCHTLHIYIRYIYIYELRDLLSK